METPTGAQLSELEKSIEAIHKSPVSKKVFVGFDGFIDTLMLAVRKKENGQRSFYRTIKEFANKISLASGKSGQIELVTQKKKIGGNGPIFANGLGKLGVRSYCCGCMGYPEVHPIFSSLNSKCEVISVLNPGDSTALEFDDGKIILSELSVFDQYDWEFVKKTSGVDRIRAAVLDSNLVALVDWVNLPHSSTLWKGVLEDIIKPSGRRDFMFLFDLCDPSKKSVDEINEILDLISSFSVYGKVTLGLNENETIKIWCALNSSDVPDQELQKKIPPTIQAGHAIYKSMNIDCLLVHPIDRTIVYQQQETIELLGRLVTEPKVQTGGGDNLNAGYCLGLLNGFTIRQCMLLGMAASGAYIQNGASPDLSDLSNYIRKWGQTIKS